MLTSSIDTISDFSSKKEVCVIYVESDQKILTLSNPLWSLPGGELNTDERASSAALRLLQSQTEVSANVQDLIPHGPYYLRSSTEDSIIHIFRLVLPQTPSQLLSARWVSIFAYRILHECEQRPADGSVKAFDFVYSNLMWKPIASSTLVSSSSNHQEALTLQKNGQTLRFDPTCRFIITFIGTAYSGKATQAHLLSRMLGLPSISDGEIYEDEEKNSPLRNMIAAYMQTHPKGCLPSEVPVGMMAKRLSSINYHSGYILRGFPLTLEQSSIFLSIFCRSADLLIPIFLNISEDQVQDRIPENDHGVTRRRADFEAGKEEVLTLLSPLSSFKQLDLIGSEDKYDVFHRVCLTVNRQLDAMQAEKQRSQIASPRQESMELSLSQIGWTTACVASVAVIAFLAGRYIHRD